MLVLQELCSHLEVGLELRDTVLVFVQQVLDFLLVHLDLNLVPFLHLFHFPEPQKVSTNCAAVGCEARSSCSELHWNKMRHEQHFPDAILPCWKYCSSVQSPQDDAWLAYSA